MSEYTIKANKFLKDNNIRFSVSYIGKINPSGIITITQNIFASFTIATQKSLCQYISISRL